MYCLLGGGVSQIGCCSSDRLYDCDQSSITYLIIAPSDSSDSESDGICDDNSEEVAIGMVAQPPAVALATRPNESQRAVCSRLLV